ncbi:hypothetical protein T439DRAFT_336923 [Meredithblackwellia eburnea MCA 4105]
MHKSSSASLALLVLFFGTQVSSAPVPVAPGVIPFQDCTTYPEGQERALCYSVINGDVIHSGNDITDHIGRQGQIAANTVGNVIDDEGGDGSGVKQAGANLREATSQTKRAVVHDVLEGSLSAVEQGTQVYGTGGAAIGGVTKSVGGAVGQGSETKDVGTGVEQVGAEAERQFGTFEGGAAGHGPGTIQAIDPNDSY